MIGEVRGLGLMVGIELVTDEKRSPATAEAEAVRDLCLASGVLVGVGGVYGNVVRVQPPLVITKQQLDQAVDAIAHAHRASASKAGSNAPGNWAHNRGCGKRIAAPPSHLHRCAVRGRATRSIMSHTTSAPTRSYGFYLNGNWPTHGREVVITSPFDHSIVAVVCEANTDDVETAIQSAVEAFAVTRKMTSYQRATILRKIAEGIRHRQRGIRPHHLPGSRQAHQGRASRGRSRHLHLRGRRRRSLAHLRRVHPARHARSYRRTLGPDAPLPHRAGLRHHAVQLPAEPRGPQSRSGHRRRMPAHPQARAANAGHGADARRSRPRIRMAARRARSHAALQ